jgi:hypothetical protein
MPAAVGGADAAQQRSSSNRWHSSTHCGAAGDVDADADADAGDDVDEDDDDDDDAVAMRPSSGGSCTAHEICSGVTHCGRGSALAAAADDDDDDDDVDAGEVDDFDDVREQAVGFIGTVSMSVRRSG